MAPKQDSTTRSNSILKRVLGSFRISRRRSSTERRGRGTPPISPTAPVPPSAGPAPPGAAPVYVAYRPPGAPPADPVPPGSALGYVAYRPPGAAPVPPGTGALPGAAPGYVRPVYVYIPQPPPMLSAGTPKWDILSRTFGAGGLNNLGIVDMNPLPPVDHDVRGKSGTLGLNFMDPIHPLVRRQQWLNLEDSDWDLLQPALKLASRLLFDPAIATFFKGLANPVRAPDAVAVAAENSFGQPIYRFDLIPCADTSETVETMKMLVNLAKDITLEFGPTHRESYGTTYGDFSGCAPTDTNFPSTVQITETYLDVLRGLTTSSDFPFCSNFDPACAILRTYFHLASCMVDEITHAFCQRYFPYGGTCHARYLVEEPYLRDTTVAETGHAYEQAVFGGRLGIIGCFRPHVAVPYGLCLGSWPGLDESASLLTRPEPTDIIFGVPMSEIHKFFTKQFWEVDVDRYSMQPFQFRVDAAASAMVTMAGYWA